MAPGKVMIIGEFVETGVTMPVVQIPVGTIFTGVITALNCLSTQPSRLLAMAYGQILVSLTNPTDTWNNPKDLQILDYNPVHLTIGVSSCTN